MNISHFLERYPAPIRPAGPIQSLGNAGGLSGARLWRWRAASGEFLLRRWPAEIPRSGVALIHGWLKASASLSFLPVPIPAMNGATIVEASGSLWEISPWMPGEADPTRPPDTTRVRLAFEGLAQFHRNLQPLAIRGPSPGLIARKAEIEAWLRSDFASLNRALAQSPDGEVANLARRWLAVAKSTAEKVREELKPLVSREFPLQPCLRDARPDHFLFDRERLSGLVDFGAMGMEVVAADLGRLLGEWIGDEPDSRRIALEAYDAARPLSPEEAPLIRVFERSAALLTGGHWARWHFLERRIFEDASAVEKGIQRGLEQIAALAASMA